MRGRPPLVDISPPHKNGKLQLSASEGQVLALLREGKSNQEIGTALGLRRASGYSYIRNLIEKFEVRSRLGVIAKGASWDDSWFEIRRKE